MVQCPPYMHYEFTNALLYTLLLEVVKFHLAKFHLADFPEIASHGPRRRFKLLLRYAGCNGGGLGTRRAASFPPARIAARVQPERPELEPRFVQAVLRRTAPPAAGVHMGSSAGRFAVDLGSIGGRCGVSLGSMWDRCRPTLEYFLGRIGVESCSIWGKSAVDSGSIWSQSQTSR